MVCTHNLDVARFINSLDCNTNRWNKVEDKRLDYRDAKTVGAELPEPRELETDLVLRPIVTRGV